jgi:tRNA A-37 threonylcarbamoyl transferase component Bud32
MEQGRIIQPAENAMSESGIFKAAVKLPAEERAAYLVQACGRDHELRRELESLLRAHDEAGSFLQSRAGPRATVDAEPFAEHSVANSPTTPPASAGMRFRRLREHAKGGLGEVFVALDEELNREVALKEIQDRYADHPGARARFLREAEVTGKLEHPGVVPVYGMGNYPDGRPFYAMRFIRGESMHQAIRSFHEGQRVAGRDPSERHLILHDLLTRFVTVCETVAYAHARGVIHRDIKPANVMLGQYGETLVVDWGLARPLESSLKERADNDPEPPCWGREAAATELGQVVGTVAFMPPEQARGERVGFASDVFSLGATLYCLLTGHPPYCGPDALAQARRGEVVPARQRNSQVPAVLEAVCGKAMESRPEHRYPTAQAFAADVRRWLAGESVSPHREPLAPAPRLWWRRKGALASVALVVVAVVVGIAAWGMIRWRASGARAWEGQEIRFFQVDGLAFTMPPGWRVDPALERKMRVSLGLRRHDQASYMALVSKEYKTAPPADKELMEVALDGLRRYFAALEWEIRREGKQKDQTGTLGGKPTIVIEFEATDHDQREMRGQVNILSRRGRAYWLINWGTRDNARLAGGWDELRSRYRLVDNREAE